MHTTYETLGYSFSVDAKEPLEKASVSGEEITSGIFLFHFALTYSSIDLPTATEITWTRPIGDALAYWSPVAGRDGYLPQGWYPHNQYSCMLEGVPLYALYRFGGKNAYTVALSECERQTWQSMYVRNLPQADEYAMGIRLFEELPPAQKEYHFTMRVDTTARPLADCIEEASAWMQSFYPNPENDNGRPKIKQREDFVGDYPLFSSWYACMQNPLQADLEASLPIAHDLGFRSMIIDDGWSYDHMGSGDYRFCGTWQVVSSKFPDMRAFVEKAHKYDIQVALWFPFGFVGEEDPHYALFADKLLANEMGAGVLDPRFPDVRSFIIESFTEIVRRYNLDGLKLDFLTNFNHPTVPARPGTDYADINDAVTQLLQQLDRDLKAIQPHCMIEYRMFYYGPSIARHCNMMRVGDCANDFMTNRITLVGMRMMRLPVAIHADMLLWSRAEKPETVAMMLQNCLFAVPQVSVLFQNIALEQLPVLRNYMSYWTKHRDLLLYGLLTVSHPEQNYTSVSVEDHDLRIVALYAQTSLSFDGKTTDAFWAMAGGNCLIESDCPCIATIYDCVGQFICEQHIEKASLFACKLPQGGRLHLESAR